MHEPEGDIATQILIFCHKLFGSWPWAYPNQDIEQISSDLEPEPTPGLLPSGGQ